MYLIHKRSIKQLVNFTILSALAIILSACNLVGSSDSEGVEGVNDNNTPLINTTNPLDNYDGCKGKETPSPANVEQACQKQNGTMKRAGMMGCYRCVVSFDDAGKSCQDSSDCQGDCRVQQSEFFPAGSANKTGVCAKDDNPFGCYQTIKNGVPQSALCID